MALIRFWQGQIINYISFVILLFLKQFTSFATLSLQSLMIRYIPRESFTAVDPDSDQVGLL